MMTGFVDNEINLISIIEEIVSNAKQVKNTFDVLEKSDGALTVR